MLDHIQVILLLCYLKLRWWFFHLHPHCVKFSVEGTEYHFQNIKTGEIHSQIIIQFKEDSPWYRWQKNRENKQYQ